MIGIIKDESPVQGAERAGNYVTQPIGRFRYVEKNFWASICKEVAIQFQPDFETLLSLAGVRIGAFAYCSTWIHAAPE